jgi:hypothetical protein
MPFSHIPKNPGDLIKSEDWNSALDAIVNLFAKFNNATGHSHSGSSEEDGPPITEASIAANAITNAKIQDGAISDTKNQDGAVTVAKVAAGTFSRDIGIAIMPSVSDGQTIPPPSGFTAQECIFFASAKFVSQGAGVVSWSYNVTVDVTGKVTILANDVGVVAAGLAMAKRGGW